MSSALAKLGAPFITHLWGGPVDASFMLIARPFTLLFLALLTCAANLYPSQFGGFREPISKRFAPTVKVSRAPNVS
jgi:hypothetical protein